MGFSLHSEWKWGLSIQHTRAWHILKKIFIIVNILQLKYVSKLLWKYILIAVVGTETNPHSSAIFSNFTVCGSFAVKGYEPMWQGHLLWLYFFSDLSFSLWLTVYELTSDAAFLNSILFQLCPQSGGTFLCLCVSALVEILPCLLT